MGGRSRLLAAALLVLTSCGYNQVVERDEEVKAAWAEVENQYKRRADVVPNLVNVVKGAAAFEQQTLQQVIEARSQATRIQIDSTIIDDPERLRRFEQVQGQLSSALSRLLAVAESYPQLQAVAAFRDLQAQLEGTENRIAVARRRFIESVAAYNKVVLRFPTSIGAKLRGMKVRPTLQGEPGAERPPEVQF